MSPAVRYYAIYRHRTEYPVTLMWRFFRASRSGCYGFVQRKDKPENDILPADLICEQLNREFHAERPNSKRVTDISYIPPAKGVLYLSMIHESYDNSIVAYRAGAEQTVNLVLDTIRLAVKKEKSAAKLQLHSAQGFQYASQACFTLTQAEGITPSMSRRGNCYDNAMAENFFSILKTECIYRIKPKTLAEARSRMDDWVCSYNHERIQLKTGVAPLSQRHSS